MADKNEGGVIVYGVNCYAMPEGCIAAMLAFTTPKDACRLAVVSTVFRSASEFDAVWDRFLPSDCEAIASRSDGGEQLLTELQSKKQLFMHLANRPLLIDGATKSFWLEKSSGKKCWMLSATSLLIAWGNSPLSCKWTKVPESRFPEVAVLIIVCWFEIHGTIKTSMLSPETRYAAYLVFKMTEGAYGSGNISAETSVSSPGKTETHNVILADDYVYEPLVRFRVTTQNTVRRLEGVDYPKLRTDGWKELKIGQFFAHVGEEDKIYLSVRSGDCKGSLVVEGIEVRPV